MDDIFCRKAEDVQVEGVRSSVTGLRHSEILRNTA